MENKHETAAQKQLSPATRENDERRLVRWSREWLRARERFYTNPRAKTLDDVIADLKSVTDVLRAVKEAVAGDEASPSGDAATEALGDLKIVKWSRLTELFQLYDFETLADFIFLTVPEDVFGRVVFKAEDGRWYAGVLAPRLRPVEDPELVRELEAEEDTAQQMGREEEAEEGIGPQ
jgi:hypothetical protein